MTFDFEVRGVNRVANKYRTAAAKTPTLTDTIVYRWSQEQRARLKSKAYPSRLAHFKHIRTGNLANSFAVARVKKGTAKIENRAPYAQWVVGDKQRNHPSFRRWWKARDVVNEQVPALVDELRTEMVKQLT